MQLSHRLVAMHIAGVAILILVVLSSVVWVSAEHNKLALESSESMVRGGVASFRARLRTLVNDYSVWDEAYDAVVSGDRDWLYSNIGNAAAEIGTLDMIVFVPRAGGPSFGWREGSDPMGIPEPLPAPLIATLATMIETFDGDNGTAGTLLAEFEGEPWVFSIARVRPVAGAPPGVDLAELPLQIHGQRLSQERLAAIGRTLLVDGLKLAGAPEVGQAEIALRDEDGRTIRYVVWDPPRPGASILRLVAVPLGLALCVVVMVSAISSFYAVRSARRLERALYDAKAADRSKTEFLSNVSHELRTPMNGILGVAQLLQTTRLDEEQQELVSVLFSSATAQMALISDLLDISRMESGNRQISTEPFEPAGVLKDVCEMIWVAAEKKRIGFAADWSALDGLSVRGDDRAFRQILTNLLGNAVKFTDRGGVTLSSRVQRDGGRAAVSVTVADTGRGIPREALPHIFERFYQVDGSLTRGVEGTGLGLAISQNLARMMGGRIEVQSEPGRGSSFELTLDFEVVENDGEARDAA
ncbi:MAG TPA: ATP-binding protein [Amaricoccus sp.]|nr:ATP-binding protein [Amaricoccus sp.]